MLGFFGRIARGWRLMSYCFWSILTQQPRLLKAALIILAVPLLLFLIGALALGQFTQLSNFFGLSTLELSQLRVPENLEHYKNILGTFVGFSALLIATVVFIVYISLFYIFRAFLQGEQVSFKAAFSAL